jgi:hypothetical protein
MKTLRANLSLNRPINSSGEKWIVVEIGDESSGCYAVTVKVSLENFAEALMGRSEVDCEMNFNDSGVIGKLHQHKEEIVPVPEGFGYNQKKDKAAIAAVLAPFEVDGWKGRKEDLFNITHRSAGNNKMRVVFTRYVDAPEETKAQEAA